MYCGKCGREIPDEDLSCPYCGDKTIRYAKPQLVRESAQPKVEKKRGFLFSPQKRKNRGILILLIAAAAIALFYNSTDGSPDPREAVEKMTEAFQQYNVNAIIEFTTYNETCQKKLGNSQYNVSELKNQLEKEYKNIEKNNEKKNYSITDTYKLSGEELGNTARNLQLFYNNVENIEEIDVVETRETVNDKEIEKKYYCLKVGGRWYVSVELLQQE